jgi:ferritin-like metal-binding protein YciE
MPLDSLYALLVEELRYLYQAENQLLTALPQMATFASTPALKRALESHFSETEEQVRRLEQAFAELGAAARGRRCKGMEGLIEELEDILEEASDDEAILDTALIGAVRRVEHYEIAAYASAVSYAELLDEARVATLLRTSLEEEKAADRELSRIAEAEVNAMAVVAGTEEAIEA